MRYSEHIVTGVLTAADELRQLILDNPSLSLLVFAGEYSNIGEYGYMACSSVRASLGEFLDCQQEVDDTYYGCEAGERDWCTEHRTVQDRPIGRKGL